MVDLPRTSPGADALTDDLSGMAAPICADQRPQDHHLFFAVLADAQAAQQAERVRDEEIALRGLVGSKVRTGRLHVTLLSLGSDAEFSEPKAWLARLAAARVDAAAFSLRLDRCLSFQEGGDRKPLVLCGSDAGIAGFLALYQQLHAALDAAVTEGTAAPRAAPPITPHMTLLYSPTTVPEHPVPPVEWRVREFQLLHNRTVVPGPYRVVARWALRAQGG